ncbi:histidine kinase [Pseudomonas endophytica]|uniref:diguanylate cyclase n=1 Tax=Pseudomonas endophytica TaxID=1563157 RepID=A0A0Q0Z0A3_9PSED|nr:diguanylate cyclase [Pseudomonas endophytica]KQB55514.1 histidine kinase [Pseudomonas endophytica]
MDNQRGRGLSFSRRIYVPRTFGLGIGCICMMPALYPLDMPTWVWMFYLASGFVWPHLAYQRSSRAHYPYRTEQRNVLIDSVLGGFWAATLQFNPLPAIIIVSMMTMNNVAIGGVKMLVRGTLAQCTGIALSLLVFGFTFNPYTTTLQIYACLPILVLYPFAVGMISYRMTSALAAHKRTLSALSRTDSLTGLLNHGSWKDLLQLSFQTCRRTHSDATLALIDIDHFKRINDTYGHIVGDSVLRQFSNELKENLRAEDLAGRYGGDEFCVILPNRSLAQTQEIMERLRRRCCDFRYADEPELRLSLSIGLASCHPAFEDASMWLNETDKALYIAKNTGRNKISTGAADMLPDAVLIKP